MRLRSCYVKFQIRPKLKTLETHRPTVDLNPWLYCLLALLDLARCSAVPIFKASSRSRDAVDDLGRVPIAAGRHGHQVRNGAGIRKGINTESRCIVLLRIFHRSVAKILSRIWACGDPNPCNPHWPLHFVNAQHRSNPDWSDIAARCRAVRCRFCGDLRVHFHSAVLSRAAIPDAGQRIMPKFCGYW